MSEVTARPIKPEDENPVNKVSYVYECMDYILKDSDELHLHNFIKRIEVELAMRTLHDDRMSDYETALLKEKLEFMKIRSEELQTLKDELEQAKVNLRKSYMKQVTQEDQSSDEEEQEEEDTYAWNAKKKAAAKKKAYKKKA